MKYYVVWSGLRDVIIRIDCHETEEAREKAIEHYLQQKNRPYFFKRHNEVC